MNPGCLPPWPCSPPPPGLGLSQQRQRGSKPLPRCLPSCSSPSPAARGAPSGAPITQTRAHSHGVPHQSCSCSPWEAPSCQVGGPGAGVDTGREAGGVPRGSLHPHPLSTVLPVTLPLQSRGWGPLSPHGADLACGVVSPRRPSAAWGAVRPSTSMHTPVLRPARGSVGVRHPCFQRSPLCNYVAPAVYTVK